MEEETLLPVPGCPTVVGWSGKDNNPPQLPFWLSCLPKIMDFHVTLAYTVEGIYMKLRTSEYNVFDFIYPII